jgi:formate dehydrogenase major subunit
VWVNSRKGRIITRAQVSDRPNKGAVYMTYQWWIGACNELVTENLSPITKTPEYKYCAVRGADCGSARCGTVCDRRI